MTRARWGSPGLVAVLALGAVALLWSWSRIDGYPLADVVEDLEWTAALLRAEHVVDSEATRPFGYLILLAPLFLVGKLAAALSGGSEMVHVVHLARLYQVAATLVLVWLTVRFSGRVAARADGEQAGVRFAALSAGVLLALNPLILRWGIEPISGVTTGIFVLLSAELILFAEPGGRSSARRGWLAGLLLGVAALTAYKSIAIVAPVFLAGLWLGVRRGLSRGGLVLGFGACLLLQSCGDLLYHGAFGESLRIYALQNIGNIAPVFIHRVGEWLGSDAIRGVARGLYEACREAHMLDYPRGVQLHERVEDLTSLRPRTWYVTHMHEALTWPGVLLAALGLGRALRGRVGALLVPAAAVVFYVALMSYKGSKDYRLWLPILPFLAALGGYGASGLASRGGLAAAGAGLAVLSAAALGPLAHARVNQQQFAGYWRAMEFVGAEAADLAGGTARTAAAFHWAVFGRAGAGVELIKLPRHLDGWERHSEDERADSLAAIAELDYFVSHLALVVARPALCEALGRDFVVAAGFFLPATEASPGPVFVFRRRRAEERGGIVLRAVPGGDPAAWSVERGLGAPLGFDDRSGLRFLGFELQSLPGDGLGWISFHWFGARAAADLRFLARVTAGDATVWSGDHAPGHGWWPTTSWPHGADGGLLLSEGYPLLEPWWGGGDPSPAELWIGVAGPDGSGGERLLSAVRPADGTPVLELSPPGAPPTPEGWRTVEAGLVRVGGIPGE